MNKTQMGLAVTSAMLLTLVGCKDDGTTTDTHHDAGVDMQTINSQDGGATDDGAVALPCTLTGQALTLSSDYSHSKLMIHTASGDTFDTNELEDPDTVLSHIGCQFALIERGMGRLKIQQDGDAFATEKTIELNQGATGSSNPQAIADIGDGVVYVARAAANSVLVVDTTLDAAEAVTREIDLSGFLDSADTDGFVDMTDVAVVGNFAYVTLGSYFFDASNGYAQTWAGDSKIAVIDTRTHELVDVDSSTTGVQSITLTHHNPSRIMSPDGHVIIVVAGGAYGEADGAIDLINPTTNTVLASLITEQAASLTQFVNIAFVSASKAVVLSTGSAPSDMKAHIINITGASATISDAITATEPNDVAIVGGVAYIAARGSDSHGGLLYGASSALPALANRVAPMTLPVSLVHVLP